MKGAGILLALVLPLLGCDQTTAPPAVDAEVDVPRPPEDMFRRPDSPIPELGLYRDLRADLPPACQRNLPCASNKQCCGGQKCLQLPTGVKVCSASCSFATPLTPYCDDDYRQSCGRVVPGSKDGQCLQRCTPALGKNSCPKGLACDPRGTLYSDDAKRSVCAHPACTSAKDCPVRLSQACDPAATVPQCTAAPAGAFCAALDPPATGGTCALPGACDLASGLCKPHKLGQSAAVIGQPCVDDRGCGGAMLCDMQRTLSGGGVHARNGYCTLQGCAMAQYLPHRACHVGSTCNRFYAGGRCMRTCKQDQAAQCRGEAKDSHGDYDCYDWTGLVTASVTVAAAPTCEPVDNHPCPLFSTPPLECSVLGGKQNATKMACRDRATGKLLAKGAAGGYCLDLTASGK